MQSGLRADLPGLCETVDNDDTLFEDSIVTQVAADAAHTARKAFSLTHVLHTVIHTLASAWADFLARVPLIGLGALVLLLAWALAWASLRIARYVVGPRARPSLLHLIERLIKLCIWAAGLLLAIVIIFPGVSPANVLGGLGLLSVAVGFAFRDTFENFFAGVLMLWKYPFEAGDFIKSGDILGRVERINIRMAELRQTTGELLLVPNNQLFKNPVTVLTDQPERRISILTGVAYSVDLAAALEVIDEAVRDCDLVQRERPVQVFAKGFGDSGMDIEVAWWCGSTPLAERRTRSQVVVAVKAALDAAGMEIPFPYRTLTFGETLKIETDAPSGDEQADA